jgi:hypothetical protein
MKSCCKEVMTETAPAPEEPKRKKGLRFWLKRVGVAGFLFFLLKGIAWLFVIWGGARLLSCD